MLLARTKIAFRGCRDGDPIVREFVKGDEVEGDLARVAIVEKWATEIKPKSAKPAKPDVAPGAAGVVTALEPQGAAQGGNAAGDDVAGGAPGLPLDPPASEPAAA